MSQARAVTAVTAKPASRAVASVLQRKCAGSAKASEYEPKVIFNPDEHGLPPIKGGLYAQLFKPGTGQWTYFARPKDLAAVRNMARGAFTKDKESVEGLMTVANQVQDRVIDPLQAGLSGFIFPLRGEG
jgi:hypothetical protein